MAGNAVIGALRVVIGADSAALDTGLKDALGSLKSFTSAFGIAIKGLSAGLIFGEIVGQIKGVIEEAVQLGKAAQTIGMPVEQLSALKFAAEQVGISFEALSTSLVRLDRNISLVAGGTKGPAADAFRALGISVTNANGTLRSNEQVLLDLADKFAGFRDGAAKSALAMAIFGRGGAEMVPLLNKGRDGIQELTDKAAELGIVIGDKTVAEATKFNDTLREVVAVLHAIWLQITAQSLPVLQQLLDAIKGLAKDESASYWANLVTQSLREVMAGFVSAQTYIEEFAKIWIAFKTLLAAPAFTGWTAFQEEIDKSAGALENLAARVRGIMAGIRAIDYLGDIFKKNLGDAPTIASAAGIEALQKFIESTNKHTAALEAEAATIGKTSFETAQLKIQFEAAAIATDKHTKITAAMRAEIDKSALAFANATEKATFQKQVFEQSRTPVEQYRIEMERLNHAFQDGNISADLFARGVGEAQRKLVQADPYAQALGQSLTTAFDSAIQGATKLQDVLANLLRDLARALANAAFRQLLFGSTGTGGGILGALFGGLATTSPKQTGGSFIVPGSGGIDNQLVAFKASPGEHVTVGDSGPAGGVVVNYAPQIDARGADTAAVARLAQVMAEDKKNLRPIIRDEVTRYRANTPGAF